MVSWPGWVSYDPERVLALSWNRKCGHAVPKVARVATRLWNRKLDDWELPIFA